MGGREGPIVVVRNCQRDQTGRGRGGTYSGCDRLSERSNWSWREAMGGRGGTYSGCDRLSERSNWSWREAVGGREGPIVVVIDCLRDQTGLGGRQWEGGEGPIVVVIDCLRDQTGLGGRLWEGGRDL